MTHIIIYILFILIILWVLMVWPGHGRRDRMEEYSSWLIAHRGLHDNKGPAPENSMAAYRRAVQAGFGIEMDVRESKDGILFLSHDDNVKRTTGVDRKISDMTQAEVRELKLFGTNEGIPLFKDALEMVKGQVPLVVEIKSENLKRTNALCEQVAFWMDSYEGQACIESFNPLVLWWYRRHHPETLRGQLSDRTFGLTGPMRYIAFPLSCCALNFLTKPDFIAYNVKWAHLARFQFLRFLKAYAMGWTPKSAETVQKHKKDFDTFIFDSFLPNKNEWREEKSAGMADQKKVKTMEKKNIIREHMFVSGQVQAVGFRYRATYIAQDLGVTGWVRNLYDGRVEMELQGTRLQIEKMMDRLDHERYIYIENVERREIPVDPHDSEFKVRY